MERRMGHGPLLPFLFGELYFPINPPPEPEHWRRPPENNPEVIRIVDAFRDQTIVKMYNITDKTEQAMVISQMLFDSIGKLEKTEDGIRALTHKEVLSNIFGHHDEGDTFLEKMKPFKSEWTVLDAFYTISDMMTGRVRCSSSDQMMQFWIKWNIYNRHFVLTKLFHITDASAFPPPTYGRQQVPIHQFEAEGN